MNEKRFVPPPVELLERWTSEAKVKPTDAAAYGYVAYKAAEWAHKAAQQPDPDSLKQRALRGLERIQSIDVVSVWVGRDAFDTIRSALQKLPD